MDQQTIDEELTHEGARALLASTAAAHLAYVQGRHPESRPDFSTGRIPQFLQDLAARATS